jgi:anaerobic selenocysteine-containing dehydrogenase
MPNEKAVFWPVDLPKERSKDPNQFMMSTRRGKQFNTLIYAEIDPLNGAARDSVLMSEVDASRLQLKHGDKVVLESLHGKMQATVFVAPIAPGNLQTHWPESNHLIPTGVVDPSGKVPDYNAFVAVTKAP